MARKASYGIDAPGSVIRLAIFGAICIALRLGLPLIPNDQIVGVAKGFLWVGMTLLATSLIMFLSSIGWKFGLRDKVVARLDLRGDERVLDVGCGRGLALIAVAKKLSTGTAVGIDIWSAEDLSHNSPEAVKQNAAIEGVADRVQIDTGDARALPYPDAHFDAVVSITALHNIKSKTDREKALGEMVRVLKPGGRLSMFDIFHPFSYVKALRRLGLPVKASGLILLWLVPGRRIWGRKPDA